MQRPTATQDETKRKPTERRGCNPRPRNTYATAETESRSLGDSDCAAGADAPGDADGSRDSTQDSLHDTETNNNKNTRRTRAKNVRHVTSVKACVFGGRGGAESFHRKNHKVKSSLSQLNRINAI